MRAVGAQAAQSSSATTSYRIKSRPNAGRPQVVPSFEWFVPRRQSFALACYRPPGLSLGLAYLLATKPIWQPTLTKS